MTFVIVESCIDVLDQSCIEVCPVDCIHTDSEDRMCYIEPNECIDCALCEPACPVEAIFKDEDVPESDAEFAHLNRLWFKDKTTTRARIEELMGSS
ncbi:MAG: ferredoxin [Gammaproteobacteria bacterium]|jgi:NAD-dependent dihydropyrimidine dehydrogenase PreA subunit|nr:ferredoxin [Gammaproteobacteria bacterium]|tara:strand:+ start:2680 stop:2967 length:288 start_codon:yes stop_codon:yes gene_type:complete